MANRRGGRRLRGAGLGGEAGVVLHGALGLADVGLFEGCALLGELGEHDAGAVGEFANAVGIGVGHDDGRSTVLISCHGELDALGA